MRSHEDELHEDMECAGVTAAWDLYHRQRKIEMDRLTRRYEICLAVEALERKRNGDAFFELELIQFRRFRDASNADALDQELEERMR